MLRLSSQQLYQLLYDNRIRHPLVFLGVAGRSLLAFSSPASSTRAPFSSSPASFSSSLLASSTRAPFSSAPASFSSSSSLRSPVRQPPFRGFPSPVPLQFSVLPAPSCSLSILKQLLFINKEDIVLGHDERRPCQVLHARIIILIPQLLRHPFLRISQVHSPRDNEDKPQSLERRRNMNQQDAIQHLRLILLQLLALRLPPPSRVGNMVFVVDRKPAGDGIRIQSSAVLEGSMRSENREFSLQLRLQRHIIILAHLASAQALKCVFYLGASLHHHTALGCLMKELGRTNLYRPAPYTFGYSKTHKLAIFRYKLTGNFTLFADNLSRHNLGFSAADTQMHSHILIAHAGTSMSQPYKLALFPLFAIAGECVEITLLGADQGDRALLAFALRQESLIQSI